MLIQPVGEATRPDGLEVVELTADDEAAIEAFRSRIYRRQDTWVQELLCNGRDAIRERGSREPGHQGRLTITLDPRTWTCTIEDNGLGMSQKTLRTVFAMLGKSTRRGNDAYTGAWGIGSKSPLKIADSFLLTTRSAEEGLKHTIRVGRYEIGGEARWGFAFLGTEPFIGESGTRIEVQYPESLHRDLRLKAARVAWCWDLPVTLRLVHDDGSVEETLLSQNDFRSSMDRLVDNAEFTIGLLKPGIEPPMGRSAILVDGVPYERSLGHGLYPHEVLIVFHSPSALDLTSGREGIDESPRSKAAVERAEQAFLEQLREEARRIAATMPATPDAALRQPVVAQLRALSEAVTGRYHWGKPLGFLGLEGDLFTQVPCVAIDPTTGARKSRTSTSRDLWTLLDAPIIVGSKWNPEEGPAVVKGLGCNSPQRLPHFIMASPDDPVRKLLEPFQSVSLSGKRSSTFKVQRFRHGCTLEQITEVEAVPKGVPVAIIQRASDADHMPDHLLTLLARPNRVALKALKAAGYVVLDEAGVREYLGTMILPTSIGAQPMADIVQHAAVGCIWACDPTTLKGLTCTPFQHTEPCIVAVADKDQQRALRYLAGRQQAIQDMDLRNVNCGPVTLADHWARRHPGLPQLYNAVNHDDLPAQRALRELLAHLG